MWHTVGLTVNKAEETDHGWIQLPSPPHANVLRSGPVIQEAAHETLSTVPEQSMWGSDRPPPPKLGIIPEEVYCSGWQSSKEGGVQVTHCVS